MHRLGGAKYKRKFGIFSIFCEFTLEFAKFLRICKVYWVWLPECGVLEEANKFIFYLPNHIGYFDVNTPSNGFQM